MSDEIDDEDVQTGDEELQDVKEKFDIRKMALFIGLPVFIVLGSLGGLYAAGFFSFLNPPAQETHDGAENTHEGGGAVGHGGGGYGGDYVFLEIPDMIVNLDTGDEQTRFLRLRVQLELKTYSDRSIVEQVMPRVIDQFQTYLRGMRVEDMKGSPGIYRLQKELIARVNAAAYPVEVQDVLFQEILIQ